MAKSKRQPDPKHELFAQGLASWRRCRRARTEKIEADFKMATHGGKRPGSGRKSGIPNKATADVKAAARKYGPAAIEELARLAGLVDGGKGRTESTQARIAAMAIILDRAYGKAAQPHTGEGGEGPVQIQELMRAVDGKTRGVPNIAKD